MFDIDQSVSEWRRRMISAGVKNPAVLDELENHLREDLARRVQSGAVPDEAFEAAVLEIGEAGALNVEFAKTKHAPEARMLTAIPVLQRITAIGPACGFYLKATGFLLPAALVWFFSVVFLMPKLREICYEAGMSVFNLGDAPVIFRIWSSIGPAMIFLTSHSPSIIAAVIIGFVLMERRSKGWQIHPRVTVGAGIFIFNFAVLLSLTLMVISALVASTALVNHVK